jgi:RHS repeat-associated protein
LSGKELALFAVSFCIALFSLAAALKPLLFFDKKTLVRVGVRGSNYPFLTLKERDNETGLDYFLARYYSSVQGRFTSPDEFTGGPDELFDFTGIAAENPTFYADVTHPQSLNKYQYCLNNPLNYVDPDGHQQALTQRIILERGYLANLSQSIGATYESAKKAVIDAKNEVVGFRARVQKALGTDRDSLIERNMKGPFALPRDRAEIVADQEIAFNDGLMIGPVKAGQAGSQLVSAIGRDKSLIKLADEAGGSVQKGIDQLTSQLAKGNLNPGLGSKNLFGNISYARARDGARVFFRKVGDQIEILAKASKANEQAVIDRLKKLYQE